MLPRLSALDVVTGPCCPITGASAMASPPRPGFRNGMNGGKAVSRENDARFHNQSTSVCPRTGYAWAAGNHPLYRPLFMKHRDLLPPHLYARPCVETHDRVVRRPSRPFPNLPMKSKIVGWPDRPVKQQCGILVAQGTPSLCLLGEPRSSSTSDGLQPESRGRGSLEALRKNFFRMDICP